jgi:transcription elongation factor GreB
MALRAAPTSGRSGTWLEESRAGAHPRGPVSKAFTSEDAPPPEAPVRAPPRLAPGEVRHVTPEGHREMREALARHRAAGDPRAPLLEGTLAVLTVLGPEGAPEGIVAFATWVTVEDEGGARSTWRIVGPDEADPRRGRISVHSPVARALLGRSPDDRVEVSRPGGAVELRVVDVSRTPPPWWEA